MALLPIVQYPQPVLAQRAEEVTVFDEALARLIADMAETMYAAEGLGLAANQVGVLQRVFVVDVGARGEEGSQARGLVAFVNPEIVERSGKLDWNEGCLSFPGLYIDVQRSASLRMRAQNERGEFFEVQADGLAAVALQHELDHLDGVTMIDRVGRLSRKLALRRFQRLKAEDQAAGAAG